MLNGAGENLVVGVLARYDVDSLYRRHQIANGNEISQHLLNAFP